MELFELLRTEQGMETFLIKNRTRGCNRSSTKNAKNGIEWEDRSSTQNRTKRDGTEQERNDKKRGTRTECFS